MCRGMGEAKKQSERREGNLEGGGDGGMFRVHLRDKKR